MEIPFLDGAEAACTNTVTHKAYLVNAAAWQAEKEKGVIVLRARDWSKIRVAWAKACIMVGDECNVYMRTVDRAVRDLDAIAGKYIKKP